MLKTEVLLFAMALSIVCGASGPEKTHRAVKEIIKTLKDIRKAQVPDACKNDMVMDIFSNIKDLSTSDAFCKAAKTLQKLTPCKAMHKNIQNLKENLRKFETETTNCTLDHSKIDLNEFLAQLLLFSRQYYSYKH
ncbi:interleukin-4-like [Amblyraja radiata]|uniref:interleukin-4-like n=1 Tax=Amblyraja radiata TaxID=386614 RepID=UPI001403A93B|nr:interleukin-4-like [Amblyraja radiata]